MILWSAEMNNKLDLEVFKSRCACLTEILSSYREGLLLLESCDLKDFHNTYMTDEFMRELKVLCEGIYSYLNINKSKTQYKSILGSSSICILYKNVEDLDVVNKEKQISINQNILKIFNVVNFLIGLMSNMENSQAKIERLNYNFYLILKMMEKSFKGFLSEVLPIISQYFNHLIEFDHTAKTIKEFNTYAKAQNVHVTEFCKRLDANVSENIIKSLTRYLDEYRIAVEDICYRHNVRIKRTDEIENIEDLDVDPQTYHNPPLVTESQSDYSDDKDNIDDEVDEDKTSKQYDYNLNEDTRRLAPFVSNQRLNRHIDRTQQPTVSNIYYLDIPLLKIVNQVLLDQLHENKDIMESAKAACCLMSIFTGQSAVIFQDIDQLLKTKQLKRSPNRAYYLWIVDANVNKNLKGQIAKKDNKYNEHTTWAFQIPAMWIDRIRKANLSNLTNTDFEKSLSEWFYHRRIGPISVTSIALQLSFHLNRICKDDLTKNFLIGRQVSHQPDLAYGGFSYKQLNEVYEQYIYLWFQNKNEVNVLDRPQFIQVEEQARVGSQRVWSFDNAKKFLNTLNLKVVQVLKEEQDIAEKFNAFSVWIWFCCLLSSGARPAIGASSIRENFDFITNIAYIHDKSSRSRPHGRYSPLIEFVVNELQHYDEFIKNINALELANTADHIYYLSYWKKGSEFMSFTLEPLTQKHIASYLSENFPEIDELYPNWTRHFVRNFLELPDAIFKSWYAHDQQNEIGFSKYSSLQPYTYMIEIQDAVNQLFKRLGLKSVVSQS